MNNLIEYFNMFYHPTKYHLFVCWQTNGIYIEPKFDTKIKSIEVKVSCPFIDYKITTNNGNIKKTTSFGVLTPLDIIGEL